MARFSGDSVERVKAASDIVEIVSAHTDLRRAGARFTGLCPFHDERTPSFSVDPAEKLYYCFGCEAGGDVFRFLQEKEGLSFPETVESLAERYGVELEREAENPRAEAARRRRSRLGDLLDRTAAFYAGFLREAPKAARAREYLAERGLGEEVLAAFGVGFAPSAWDQVLTRGQRAGFSVEELQAAGLVQKGQKGGHYDRFRARITFPIRDARGRVLGFGGRALSPDSKPKYLNSPEGELYRKSRTLYGIDVARAAIAKAGRAIVVEGYTDVLALHQAGITESVAVMGTAITPDQLQMLSRITETVVLALDADRSGADAMIRAEQVAAERSIDLRVAGMPDEADPADMLGSGGLDNFQALVEDAIDLPSFHIRTALKRGDLHSTSGRERVLTEVGPWLNSMEKPHPTFEATWRVGRDELIREVANRLNTEPSLVVQRVRSAPRGDGGAETRGAATEAGDGPALTPRELRERALLAMCIAAPEPGRGYLEKLSEAHLSSPAAARALAWLRDHLAEPMAGLPREDEELVSLVTQLVMSAEREPASQEAMELNFLQLEQRRLEDEIAAAQDGGDDQRGSELSRERAELVERIQRAEALET
jgi:DNA primase